MNQLQKVINLSRRTGDRIIVFDSENPENSYVIISVSEYEKIISNNKENLKNLTEDELIEKINRDIAIWKSENDYNNIDFLLELEKQKNNNFSSNQINNKRKIKGWVIRKDIKEAAEEVKEEEMEENKHYLEEI